MNGAAHSRKVIDVVVFHVLPHKVIESWTRMCSHVPLIYFGGYYDNKIPDLRVTV